MRAKILSVADQQICILYLQWPDNWFVDRSTDNNITTRKGLLTQ